MYDESFAQMKREWEQIIDFGPRPFGTEKGASCSDFLRQKLASAAPDAQIEDFHADACWVEDWDLEVMLPNPRKLTSYLFLGSGGSDGIFEGEIRYAGKNGVWGMYNWDRFSVVDQDEEILAYITVRDGGEAVPQMLFFGESWLPHFIVGQEEKEFFLNAAKEKTIIRGFANAGKIPNAHGRNVVGTLPGDDKKIILCAHYDTVYATAGAYDNSAGAAVVLEIARRIAGRKLNTGVEILLTDGEEYNLAGAFHHSKNSEGVAMVLNIDGVGRDKELEVWCGPEPFEQVVRKYLESGEKDYTTLYKCPPPPGSDHAPYYSKGIPSCMLTFNDQGILHSPKDVYDESKLENMAVMVKTVIGLLEYLEIVG